MSCAQRANRSEPEVLPVLFESRSYSPCREYDISTGQLARRFSLNVDTLIISGSLPSWRSGLVQNTGRPGYHAHLIRPVETEHRRIGRIVQRRNFAARPVLLVATRRVGLPCLTAGTSLGCRVWRHINAGPSRVRRVVDLGTTGHRAYNAIPATRAGKDWSP